MKVPFDSLTLRAIASEVRPLLNGGVIQHIAQPAAADLVLTIRNHGANYSLLLSCDATSPRAYLTSVRRPNPPTPPAFCMACRKYLEGSRIAEVTQRGFDRILDIDAVDREGVRFNLTAELMGKHSNIILVREDGRIVDSAKRISHRQSRFREVLPGKTYQLPPAPEGGTDPFDAEPAELQALASQLPPDREARASRLQSRFQGISPFLANELVVRIESSSLREAWDGVFGPAARCEWTPVVIRNDRGEPIGAYPIRTVQYLPGQQNDRESANRALDHFYSVALPRAALDAATHQLAVEIDRAISAKRKYAYSLEQSAAETARAEEFKETGELILSNLYRIPAEADTVTVTDFFQPEAPERTIRLDARLTAQENAERWFRKYRKARDGATRLQEQLERVRQEILGLEGARCDADELRDLQAVQSFRKSLTESHLLRPMGPGAGGPDKRAPDYEGKKIRVIHTAEGWEILVGENSEANDYLTSRVASPNDWWMHVRANASAHVVVRTGNQPQSVPPSVLRQAAELAARHSPAKHSSLVPVDYTLRKYVRKPRGAAPGAALYQNEKTIYVTPAE